MKRLGIVLSTALLGLAAAWACTAEPALSHSERLDGKAVFLDSGCVTCHSVPSAGLTARVEKMKASDLVDLGERYEAEWVAKYIRGTEKLDGMSHRKPFKGSDEELQALVDWLLEQKSE